MQWKLDAKVNFLATVKGLVGDSLLCSDEGEEATTSLRLCPFYQQFPWVTDRTYLVKGAQAAGATAWILWETAHVELLSEADLA